MTDSKRALAPVPEAELKRRYDALLDKAVELRALTKKMHEEAAKKALAERKDAPVYRSPRVVFEVKGSANVRGVFEELDKGIAEFTPVLADAKESKAGAIIQRLKEQLNGREAKLGVTAVAGAKDLASEIAFLALDGYKDECEAAKKAFDERCRQIKASYDEALQMLEGEKKTAEEKAKKSREEKPTADPLKVAADEKALKEAAAAHDALKKLEAQIANLRNNVLEKGLVELERFQAEQIEQKKALVFKPVLLSEVKKAQEAWENTNPSDEKEGLLGVASGARELKEGTYKRKGYSYGIQVSKDQKGNGFYGTLVPDPATWESIIGYFFNGIIFKNAYWELYLKMNPKGNEAPLKLGVPGQKGGESPEEISKLMREAYDKTSTDYICQRVQWLLELAKEKGVPLDVSHHLQYLKGRIVPDSLVHRLSSFLRAIGLDSYFTYDVSYFTNGMYDQLQRDINAHNSAIAIAQKQKMDGLAGPEKGKIAEEEKERAEKKDYESGLLRLPPPVVGRIEAEVKEKELEEKAAKLASSGAASSGAAPPVEEKSPEEIVRAHVEHEIAGIERAIKRLEEVEANIQLSLNHARIQDEVDLVDMKEDERKLAGQVYVDYEKHKKWLSANPHCPRDVREAYVALEARVRVMEPERMAARHNNMKRQRELLIQQGLVRGHGAALSTPRSPPRTPSSL